MRKNLLPKGGSIYMGVYLCCSNAFVTEKYLDDPQICAAFKQCRSERMSQSMWTDCFLYSRIGGAPYLLSGNAGLSGIRVPCCRNVPCFSGGRAYGKGI